MPRTAARTAVEADLAFHRALLAASHNEMLDRMETVISTGLAFRDRLVHATGHRPMDPVPHHGAVLEAVRAGDADAAEAAMRTLLDQAARDLDEIERAEPSGPVRGRQGTRR